MLTPNSSKENSLLTDLKTCSNMSFSSSKLSSALPRLDQFLEGGLRVGELSEWGMPLGCGGREIILSFLSSLQRTELSTPYWSLWISGHKDVDIYPPAWIARGVDLRWLRFAYSSKPLQDLKAVFFNSLFRVIIIDSPQHLSLEDCALLSQRARIHQQVVIILRHYFLSAQRGNVWAKLRLNCWQSSRGEELHLKIVRGLSPRNLILEAV